MKKFILLVLVIGSAVVSSAVAGTCCGGKDKDKEKETAPVKPPTFVTDDFRS